MWSTLTSFSVPEDGIIWVWLPLARDGIAAKEHTTMTYVWYEAYKTAVLETDWTKMQERLQSAEGAIKQRQRVLSMDHGGTPAERQAIADALSGMRSLKAETAAWQNRQASDSENTQSRTD